MNKRRVLAWIGIIAVPVLYLISLILSIVDAPIAGAFLMVTIVASVVFPVVIYLFIKYPKDIADMVHRIREADEEKHQKK